MIFDFMVLLQNASAVHLADVLLQNMELGKYIDNVGEINIHRDKMMAENIMWILKQEEAYSTLYRILPRGN